MESENNYMPTEIQFKYELRKQLTELKRKLEMLKDKKYDTLEKEYQKEIDDIEISLQD